MISQQEYERRPESWWINRRVRADVDITTKGGVVFRKGRIAKITRKYGGFAIRHTRAPNFFCRNAHPGSLTLLEGRA